MLSKWAMRSDPKIAGALKKLSKLPKEHHGVSHGFPIAGPTYREHARLAGHHELQKKIADAPIVSVPIDSLWSNGQRSVRPERVEEYIAKPDTKPRVKSDHHPVDHPIVIRDRGKNIIYDGYHRSVSRKLLGDSHVNARYVNLDEQ